MTTEVGPVPSRSTGKGPAGAEGRPPGPPSTGAGPPSVRRTASDRRHARAATQRAAGQGLAVFALWLVGMGILVAAESRLLFPARSWSAAFRSVAGSWDAGWLRSIAEHGYSWNGNASTGQNVSFLPLFPLAERGVHLVTGLSFTASGFLASVVFQGAFLVVVAVLVSPGRPVPHPAGDPGPSVASGAVANGIAPSGAPDARWERAGLAVLVLAAVYPASIFGIQGYGTSLTVFLVAAGFLMVRHGRPAVAALFFGLATAVDPSALAAPVGYALYEWVASRSLTHPVKPRVLGRELLGVGGFLADMAYLGIRFHDPLAKLQGGQAWFPHRTAGRVLDDLVTFRAVGRGLEVFFTHTGAKAFSYTLDGVVVVALMAVVALVWWRGGFGWEVAVPLVGVVPLLLQAAEYGYPYSITRLSYPLWLALALHPWVRRQLVTRRYLLGGLVAAEGIVLALWSVLLVQGRWVN